MSISRRWFLKSAAMAMVGTQLPLIAEEGHRVLFFDGGAHLVTDYLVLADLHLIKAKVVNGAWDMVVNTRKKTIEAWSNPAYGYDAGCTVAELKTTQSYNRLIEIQVDKSIGEVPEHLKPHTVMVGKYAEEPELQPSLENGKQVLKEVYMPVMKQVTHTYDNSDRRYWVPASWDGPGHWEYGGVLTMTWWVHEQEPVVVDPLFGAGCDYNAIIEAAVRKRTWGI